MDYDKYLKENEEESIEALCKVLRCKSEEAPAYKDKDGVFHPFGAGVQEALDMVLEMGSNMGFTVYNCDNYMGHIDFEGTGENGNPPKIFGIIGHLDVVPAGTGWDFEPYGGEVKDGVILGRGTTDDKGPMISCLYAMKALKDAGFKPKNTIRLLLGLDEETNWKGVDYYFSKVRKPDYGFTPDAEFPVINAEKGGLVFDLNKKFKKYNEKGLHLRSVKGGTAPNAVPAECRAILLNDKDGNYDEVKNEIDRFKLDTGYKVNYKVVGKSIEIVTTGIASHGAKPEDGLNAISIMMSLLSRFYFVNEDRSEFIDFYNKHIGFDLKGTGLKMNLHDDVSGDLVFNNGMIDMDKELGNININVRYPVTLTPDDVYKNLPEILEKWDIGLVKTKGNIPIYLELDNPMVKTLLKCYRDNTLDYESKPLVIGGGTYAKTCPGLVAYGAMFPGDEDRMHQKNECLAVEKYRKFTKIYCDAIYKLANEDYE